MNNSTTLVIMAAGMGSRYGGIKQIKSVGPNGEIILDFSVYDAVKAGFEKIVFIIRRDIEKDFREVVSKRIEKIVDVDYVFQELSDLPKGYAIAEGRAKPLGTGHAVYCARKAVTTPFALINADDYYGQTSFRLINDYIKDSKGLCMVGFELGNTLTENGTVSRGVCEVKDGYLSKITEHTKIDKNSGFPMDMPVSMNMWGLYPNIFDWVESDLCKFLDNIENPLKDEFYIPSVIDNMITNEGAKVKVLHTNDKWYGITYKEDEDTVIEAMKKLVGEGYYTF